MTGCVALRKESVDRNDQQHSPDKIHQRVALRKESVDRNLNQCKHTIHPPPSLSARRAWIEIKNNTTDSNNQKVALRKESVDRNILYPDSAPANWVALRKESVDRNL